jgi:hypothetical protein
MNFLTELLPIFRWISIVFSPLLLSFIPFLIFYSKNQYSHSLLIIPIIGLIVGIVWAEKVRRNKRLDEYKSSNLMNTPDLIETWENDSKSNLSDKLT